MWEKNLPGRFRNNFKMLFNEHQRGLDTAALQTRERESWEGAVREGPQRKGEFSQLQNRAIAGRMAQFVVQT